MSWNPQQQAMLSAMGYTLYRQAGAPVPPNAAASSSHRLAEPEPAFASAGSGDRLLQALARAAGGHDLAALALPPIEQLRASGAAKRALWPTLRALRRKR
jgi:hypothetical protein